MTIGELGKLIGIAAPWMAAVFGLFVAAFLQGRAIWIWPPRIGPRPADRRRSPERAPAGRAASAHSGRVDREYGVDRAWDFYQEIAPTYDLRNSGNLVSTHLATVARLQAIRAQRSSLRVLDLGGGTGKLIAIHFFNDAAITWTYVDFCPAMAAEFRRNLAGYPLGRNSEVIVDDLVRALRQLEPESYDVVVLSLVLSSMPGTPDLASIAQVLAPDGLLIVTDINPGYTHANPLYKVPVDGAVVALRTTPVDPFEVIRQAKAVGMHPGEQHTFGEGPTYYSYMTVFTHATRRPDKQERGDENLVRS